MGGVPVIAGIKSVVALRYPVVAILSKFRDKSDDKFVKKSVHQTFLVMKNNPVYLLCLSVILLMASSFVLGPVSSGMPLVGEEINAETPSGGAYLMYAGKNGGNITPKEITGQTELKVDGCAKGSRIFEFTLHITKGGKTSTFSHRSNTLSSEMLKQLQNLSRGDVFEFKNTKAYLPNGNDVVDVHAPKFTVV